MTKKAENDEPTHAKCHTHAARLLKCVIWPPVGVPLLLCCASSCIPCLYPKYAVIHSVPARCITDLLILRTAKVMEQLPATA